MSQEKSRVLIIGAGVNGSAVASGLFHGGVDVTVLARGKRFDELCGEGIVIENPFNQKRTVTRVPVIDQLAPNDLYDYILVIVRKNQTFDLLPILAHNQSPNIVFMGNNLSGPAEFIKFLGTERVLMGAVYAAGKRDGSLIRAMVIKSVAAPFGEINGSITPRLTRLADTIRQGGFKVALSKNIVDTQMTHAVGIAPLAMLVMKHNSKVRLLAQATDDIRLYVHARREGHHLMLALGHQVLPRSEMFEANLPVFLQLIGMRLMLNSRLGLVGLEYHITQAPDEMLQLAKELKELVNQSELPVPALRKILE